MKTEKFDQAIREVCDPLPGSFLETSTYKLTVKKRFEGLTVVDFFLKAVPRSTAQIWIDKINVGNLKVNDKTVSPNYQVKAGEIATHETEPKREPSINTNIRLIYADDYIWVIEKPSPLPVHASGRFIRNTLLSILEKAFPAEMFKIQHRIDANTTGVLVIAKDRLSANFIQQQFEKKTVKKQYIALVEGIVKDDHTSLNDRIGNKVLVGGAREVSSDGKKSATKIEVIERRIDKNQTLLKVIPLTGRTNQIRLHLAELGHPIVGDIGYKDLNYFKDHPFTYSDDSLFLHAHELTIVHPQTKEEITFSSPIPEKFNSN